jgi:hypothetical protein
MGGGAVLVAGLAAGAGLVACGCGGADESLRDAIARTRSAPYLVVSSSGGRRLLLSAKLNVIERHGRVLAWTRSAHELTWRENKHCYDRHTDFNRDDVRQEREAVTDVVAGREEDDEGHDVEYESTLDSSGRLATVRWRAAEFGGQPAGRWYTARYRYPSAGQFASLAGPAPGPRCR